VDDRRAISVQREIEDATQQVRGSMVARAEMHGRFYGQIRRAAAGKLRHGKDDAVELEARLDDHTSGLQVAGQESSPHRPSTTDARS
jgi:hypothetical protein